MASVLPAIAKSYQCRVNSVFTTTGNTNTDGKTVMLSMKQSFVGAGSGWVDLDGNTVSPTNSWTVAGSSNGVAASMDEIDRWSVLASLVNAAEGSAHSWIVLQNDNISTGFQICINLDNGGLGNMNGIGVWVSPAAGFTGGSITNRPTATDEIQTTGQNNGAWFSNEFNASVVLHFMQSTDGEVTRVIGYYANSPQCLFQFEKVQAPAAGWATPAVFARNDAGITRLSYSVYFGTQPLRAKIGATVGTIYGTSEASSNNFIGVLSRQAGVPNVIDGTYPLAAVGVDCSTVGAEGYFGYLADLWTADDSLGQGSIYPATGDIKLAQFGALVVPWPKGVTPYTQASMAWVGSAVDGRIAFPSSGGAPGSILLTNFDPPLGSQLTAGQAVTFDAMVSGAGAFITAAYPGGAVEETVFDGTNFKPRYLGYGSVEAITGGYRFTLLRDGGWIAPPTLVGYPVILP